MRLLQFLNTDGFICCSKMVIKALGVFEALVLGKLCSVAQRFNYKEFYVSMDKICDDIGLSEYQTRTAIDNLKRQGFLIVTRKGIPCRNYYYIDECKLYEFFDKKEEETSSQEFEGQEINLETSSQKIQEQELKEFNNKQPNDLTSFKEFKKDNKKDNEKENLNSSSESVVYNSNFSRANLINSECFEETGNCFREVHEIWVKNELPLSRASHDFFTFSCRELKNALGLWSGKGVHEAELFEALDNYIQVAKLIKEGGSWMETVGGFEFFAKHIFDFVEGSFDINKYKRSKTAVNIGQKEKVDINKILAEMGEL